MITKIQTYLQHQSAGVTVTALAEKLSLPPTAENHAMLEFVCLMTPGLRQEGGQWRSATESKTATIIACLENFAQTSGKRIFRAEAALKSLPIQQHPTTDELQQAIGLADGKLELLPNQMIKFKG